MFSIPRSRCLRVSIAEGIGALHIGLLMSVVAPWLAAGSRGRLGGVVWSNPTGFPFGVAAMVCDNDPGNYWGREEPFPDGCWWQAGVRLSLETLDARPMGSCVTLANGWCHVMVTTVSTIIREDTSTLPPGYSPKQNPVLREVTANGAWVINVPTSTLPPTGDDAAVLAIHSRFCPPGYDGPEETFYQVCHSTPPDYPQAFFLADVNHSGAGLLAGTIDPEGNVTFSGVVPGTYNVTQGYPATVERLWVYCSRDWNPDDRLPAKTEPLRDQPLGRFTTELTLEPNANVLCDFYAVPSSNDRA